MNTRTILWPLMLYASLAIANPIEEPPNPPSIPLGNIYMAGSMGSQAEDSGLAATAVSTAGYRTHDSSADVALSLGERVAAATRTWSASRTWTLACASGVPAGQAVQIIDPARLLSPTNSLTIVAGCSDTLNGVPTGTAQLTSPGSRAIAISDGTSNWQVTIVQQPGQTLDFANDFGGVPATAIGTTDCDVANTDVSCPNTPITDADNSDQFEVQAGNFDGTTLITTVTSNGANPSTRHLTLSTGAVFDNQHVSVIDTLFVCNHSDLDACTDNSGYAFGSTQTLPKGTGSSSDVQATASPRLMTIVAVQRHSGGSMGTNGPVTLTLNPTGYPNALSGAQATFSGSISGNTLQPTITLVSGALYRSIDSSYTYDTSGWYENIPVSGGNLNGATVDIKFAVVTEVITNAPNVYLTTTIPCNNKTGMGARAASIPNHADGGTTDYGTGLSLRCLFHKPLVSFGHDNLPAIKAVNLYESNQIKLHAPVCVRFSGRFLSKAMDLGATTGDTVPQLITGGPCLIGDAQILSGIFIFPNQTKSETGDLVIFPIVDANGANSGGPVQQTVVAPTGATPNSEA